jgi:hypothetical protein
MNQVTRTPAELQNWNGTDRTRPAVEVTPETEDDLVAIVRGTSEFPSPVRAVGHLHSTNPCFSTNVLGVADMARGTLVQMRPGFTRIEVVESGGEVLVRAGGGAQLIDVRNALRPLGRELAVSPEIGNATVGSVACGGTKDATLNPMTTRDLSQISSLVVEARLVDASGNKVRVDASGAQVIGGPRLDFPDLRAFGSSYGLFGIVYEVTLRTTPRVPLETGYEWMPFPGGPRSTPEQIPHLDAVFGGAEAVLGFLQPYRGGMLVERRTRRPGATITIDDRIRRALRDWIWEWGVSVATRAAGAVTEIERDPRRALQMVLEAAADATAAGTVGNPLTREFGVADKQTTEQVLAAVRRVLGVSAGVAGPIADALKPIAGAILPGGGAAVFGSLLRGLDKAPQLVFDAIRGFTAHRSDSMLDFVQPASRQTMFDFTFWLFPVRGWRRTVSEYLAFCDRIHRGDHGGAPFRASLFTQVYFMGQDQSSLLSPCPDEPAFSLDVAHTAGVQPDLWRDFNERYNLWAAEHDGRPLLNQTKHLESTANVKTDVLGRAFGADWSRFAEQVRQANPPLPGAPAGRFVSDFFERLLPFGGGGGGGRPPR